MKRIPYVALLTALSMFVGAAAFAQSDSTKAAEEKKETPAQEKAEEKAEKAAKAAHHKAPKLVLDVNTASKEDLMKVPGITEDLAEKISGGRPYKSRGELMSKSILTKAEYAKVRSHLKVMKATAAAAK